MTISTAAFCTIIVEGNNTIAVETPFGEMSSGNITLRHGSTNETREFLANFMQGLKLVPYDQLREHLDEVEITQELINSNNELGALVSTIDQRIDALQEGSNVVTINYVFNENLVITFIVRATGVMEQVAGEDIHEDDITWDLHIESADPGITFLIPNGDQTVESNKITSRLGQFDRYEDLGRGIFDRTVSYITPSKESNMAAADSLQVLKTQLLIDIQNFSNEIGTEVIAVGFKPLAVADSLFTMTLISHGGPSMEDLSDADEKFIESLSGMAEEQSVDASTLFTGREDE